jgi:hypothetical protein
MSGTPMKTRPPFLMGREPIGELREAPPYKFPLWGVALAAVVAFAVGFWLGSLM